MAMIEEKSQNIVEAVASLKDIVGGISTEYN